MVPRAGIRLRAAALRGAVLAIVFAAARVAFSRRPESGPTRRPGPGQDKTARAAGAPNWTLAADRVLLLVNDNSPLSRDIAEYYARRRGVPPQNICHIKASTSEEISREDYDRQIARVPWALFSASTTFRRAFITSSPTAGLPLKISGVAAKA